MEADLDRGVEIDPVWRKRISPERDRLQSKVLVGLVTPLLLAIAVWRAHGAFAAERGRCLPAAAVSIGFALIVWRMRSATGAAAAAGGLICFDILLGSGGPGGWKSTGFPSLLLLFLLTFAATRFGRRRKESMGVAEARRGRRISQVIANLGMAGLFSAGGAGACVAGCVAALAEATADTVSSEMGQAIGGGTFLVTSWRRVPAGTDGGVSLAGTLLGIGGAALVIMAAMPAIGVRMGARAWGAACVGLIFDSVLGATAERRGWIGNDFVNFLSTAVSAGAGYLMAARMA